MGGSQPRAARGLPGGEGPAAAILAGAVRRASGCLHRGRREGPLLLCFLRRGASRVCRRVAKRLAGGWRGIEGECEGGLAMYECRISPRRGKGMGAGT